MINGAISILILLISRPLTVMFPGESRVACTRIKVSAFNCRNKQGYRYDNSVMHFQSSIANTMDWWKKNNLKKLLQHDISQLQQGISQPEFYGDLVYRFRKKKKKKTRKGPAQARVLTEIFHAGLRRETCSDVRIILGQSQEVRKYFISYLRSKQSDSHACVVEGLKLIVDVRSCAWPTVVELVVFCSPG